MIWQGPGMGALLYVTEGKRMREPVTDGERGICAPRNYSCAQMKSRVVLTIDQRLAHVDSLER